MNEFCTKKGIRREFSNARTLQQNGVAERRNRTLIEAARTMLADAKLPVTFWAEAVNTACYVQNRVLVNKSQNKTPYELFNSRIHAIGFLRPFGCHVMILNTLDHLGKFDAKGDECYFAGYSLSSKAFRVFNKRTKKVEENFHVDFLENKLIEKGAGPNWLFDIDTLTNSMNYVPVVVAGTSSTNISGTKDVASQAVKKDVSSLRYIALPNWFHEAHMETSNDTIRNSDAQDDSQKEQDCNADVFASSGISNPNATLKVPSADHVEPVVSLTVEYEILTISSPIPTVCLDISLESSSSPRLISKGDFSQKEAPSLGNALTLSNRFEDTFGDTTNAVTLNKVEANLRNMETSIPVSPTPTFRIHKDHQKSQIIGLIDTPVQTRHKSKDMEELKLMIEGLDRSNEVIAKHLSEYEQAKTNLCVGEKIELISELVKYQDHRAKILKYQA
uniref:Retrovirus-related Pol polyprotein from transposon TNT 1-94 n=1 Tax=Tanacetum cinerariifolium TaxID=118510 RepID=A0A6L2M2T1_TANCI|nr:retrovirus-related Pol polyprotein from transposon TNT 1-94 [Tanacetum cinerariifolium]